MKNYLKWTLILLLAAVFFAACQKDEDEDNTLTVQVNVLLPEDFPPTAIYSGEVKLESITTDAIHTVSAQNSVAIFEGILPGVYKVMVSLVLSKQQIQTMAPELGVSADVILSGQTTGFQVLKDGEIDVVTQEVRLTWMVQSSIIISKLFWNGTKSNTDRNQLLVKSLELYNNTAETVYLDGLCIGQLIGNTTSSNPCALYLEHEDAAYVAQIARFEGTHGVTQNIPLAPYSPLVIALIAQNYIVTEEGPDQMTMAQDLTQADYEIFATSAWWVDNPDVPNINPVYSVNPAAGFAGLNVAMILFFATESDIDSWETGVDESSLVGAQRTWQAKRVLNTIILDAIETFRKDANQQKRIPDAVDAQGIEGVTQDGNIFDRKVLYITEDGHKVLKNTNNSAADFVEIHSRDRENYCGAHLILRDYDKPEIQPSN
jgi:hypothetical protein